MPWLINPSQLDKFRKNQKNVVILDASWYLPEHNLHPREEFLKQHIMGARFLNLDDFHEHATALPHMLTRDEKHIAERLGALGITADHKVIFYDHSPLHTSCRALWMFKVFGHNPNQLYILDGGITAWQEYEGQLEGGEPRQIAMKSYEVRFQPQWMRTLQEMKDNLRHPTQQVFDMRHPIRFVGAKDPRPHMRAGHIPGSISFPYFTMFESDGRFKQIDQIRKQLNELPVSLNEPIVTTCGSAITASILNFVLDLMELKRHAVYNGSWSEWGRATLYPGEASLDERPVETCLD